MASTSKKSIKNPDQQTPHDQVTTKKGNGKSSSLTKIEREQLTTQSSQESIEEHRARMEFARIEHERRMEVIEEEAALVDEKWRRFAIEITPSNDRLKSIAGTFQAPPGIFDDEELPY